MSPNENGREGFVRIVCMISLEEITESFPDSEFLIVKDFHDCIVGVSHGEKIVYSIPKCIEALMRINGWDNETATEYFEYNVLFAYMGEKNPIFIYDTL